MNEATSIENLSQIVGGTPPHEHLFEGVGVWRKPARYYRSLETSCEASTPAGSRYLNSLPGPPRNPDMLEHPGGPFKVRKIKKNNVDLKEPKRQRLRRPIIAAQPYVRDRDSR